MTPAANSRKLDAGRAWALLRGLAERARREPPSSESYAVRLDGERVVDVDGDSADLLIRTDRDRCWARPPGAQKLEPDVANMLDLYAPLCVGPGSGQLVVGHLAQSLDGRIATRGGESQFITGNENVEHSHRMRALFESVLVGSRTVEHDDPRLTTRRVAGANATRVVLDPTRRLGTNYRVFSDDEAPTLLVCAASRAETDRYHGCAELVAVEDTDGRMETAAILSELSRRGLGRVFVEGGGLTVSRFLGEGLLDRLHVAVAPVVFGSGRPAFTLPVIDSLDQAIPLACRRFASGSDVLFDCTLPRRASRP